MLRTHVSFGNQAFELYGHKGEYIQAIIAKLGLWEPQITRAVEQILETSSPEDGLVVDCGAHIGYYSMLAAKMGYSVFAIEPVFHEELHRAAITNKVENLIHVEPVAVGAELGTCNMRVFKQTGMSQVAAENEPITEWHQKKGGGIIRTVNDVPMATLDSLLGGESRILLMKVDAEGLEPEVFQGFRKGLETRQATNLLVEVTPQFLGVEVCVALTSNICEHGYDCYDLGIIEIGHYERTDVLGGLTRLSLEQIKAVLSSGPQTNFLFRAKS